MARLCRNVLLSASLFMSSALASAGSKLILCVGDWEGYASPDLKSGAYIDLMNEVFAPDHQIEWRRESFPKCKSDFAAGKIDVLVGENKSDSTTKGSAQFDAAYLLAIHRAGEPKEWSDKSLSVMRLAWPRGYGFERMIGGKLSFSEVNNMAQGLRQLGAKRFDVYIDDDIDAVNETLAKPEFKKMNLKVATTKIKEIMVLIFKDGPDAKKLIAMSDQKINGLRKSGRIKAIFEKYDLTYVE
jgi:polar amino acid transport system substrate-binding protein